MGWLLDTCVLVRLADQHSREHRVADAALERLLARNELLFISAQVLAEFWAVATRPEAVNGLGWSIATASEAIIGLREQFPLLAETADTVDCWFELVNRCQVAGKRAHDARLAALLLAHGVQQVLTFNTADFPGIWGVDAVHPDELLRERLGR
jgi:predicted nucleic acid-binding protein